MHFFGAFNTLSTVARILANHEINTNLDTYEF